MLKIQAIAPSGKIDSEKFNSGKNNLESLLDCHITVNDSVYSKFRGMAGTDENRSHDLFSALSNPNIDISWAIRGGFGATRVLRYIPKNLKITNKLLIGYSDITAYQWAFYTMFGLQSISGQMIQVDFYDTIDKENDYYKLFSLINQTESEFDMPKIADIDFKESSIEGTIIGGCLSIISKMLGTPFVPTLKDKILFLEDIDEPIYRIDGYLSHLYNAGLFNHVKAVIFGNFTPHNSENSDHYNHDLSTVLDEYSHLINKPIIRNFPIGHIPHIFPLPIGYKAYLTKDKLIFSKK